MRKIPDIGFTADGFYILIHDDGDRAEAIKNAPMPLDGWRNRSELRVEDGWVIGRSTTGNGYVITEYGDEQYEFAQWHPFPEDWRL